MMLVSVIVPVYNVYSYIDKCIESIVNQSYTNLELILVNDGSTDGSDEKCRTWEGKDSRIKLISQENKGVSVARNEGIKAAKGEYITFVDADDYLDEEFLHTMVSAINGNYSVDMAICGYNYIRGGNVYQNSFFSGDRELGIEDRNELIRMATGTEANPKNMKKKATTNIGGPCMRLVRRDFIELNNILFPPNLRRMQDTVFSIRCFANLQRGIYIDRFLYNYIYREGSSVNKYYPDYEFISEKVIEEIATAIQNTSLTVSEKKSLLDYKTILLLYETIKLQIAHPECKMSIRKKIHEERRICRKSIFAEAVKEIRFANNGVSFVTLFALAVRMRLYLPVYLAVELKAYRMRH